MTTDARTGRRRAFLLGAAVMLVLWTGTVVAWAAIDANRSDVLVVGGGSNQHSMLDDAGGLEISGSLAVPLVPGSGERLDLVLDNATRDRLAITGLTVRIAEVVAPNATAELACGVDDFAIEQTRFALELDASSASSLTDAGADVDQLPLVTMRDTAVDQAGCMGATLALEYAALGTPA
ncbi:MULTISPECIES: hypothetical protein [unclassified Agrococcus]|uniref:hypothetical protein n=1 Tax=unclassified Agrococcus TaxID=2615065 RepID=UPI0036115743